MFKKFLAGLVAASLLIANPGMAAEVSAEEIAIEQSIADLSAGQQGESDQISMGGKHGAAITKDESLYTWGSNMYGQLGNGTTTLSSTPVKVMDNVVAVSLGNE